VFLFFKQNTIPYITLAGKHTVVPVGPGRPGGPGGPLTPLIRKRRSSAKLQKAHDLID